MGVYADFSKPRRGKKEGRRYNIPVKDEPQPEGDYLDDLQAMEAEQHSVEVPQSDEDQSNSKK